MGLKSNGDPDSVFNPNDLVNRAQFGTAFSRALYGETNNSETGLWYEQHLQALKTDGIMNQITIPTAQELRGYVMLMMMRAYETLKTD